MRLVAMTLAFALLSLAFAPAPFPKAERQGESEQRKQERLLRECRRRLDELGVKWRLQGDSVVFSFRQPVGSGQIGGSWGVDDGDVARTLRRVIVLAEEYLGLARRLKP
jgi:hypothetical protein